MAFDRPNRDSFASSEDPIQFTLRQARALRDRRAEFFDAELFSDPAWDILLLLASEPERTGIAADEIAATLGFAPSVTTRWLKILQAKNQVESDGAQPAHYRLADRALEGLINVFAGICEPEAA